VANFGERYELISRVGSGGMGEVWLAYDERLADRPVAIKIMHQHMLPNTDDLARFEREMRFAAMMDHPNIVTVYTTGTYEGAPFMVMEYLRGHDLDKALHGGDAGRIAGIGRDICSGLAYAHGQGVLHRDIKPSNLFLCESGQVKITDFGIAKALGGATLSTAGTLIGTFAYMSPERWRAEPPAFSNDIWAAGCVLYRLISGRLPRVLPGAGEYAGAAMRGDPIPSLRDITDTPAWLADAVMSMLAADPGSRPTAADCVELLSGTRVSVPAVGRRGRRLPFPGWPDRGQPKLSPVIAAASDEPTDASMTGQPAARPTARRSRRPRRVTVVIGGLALLLLAGSVAAWRLSASPDVPVLASRSTTAPAPAGRAAAMKRPAASASAHRSRAAATPPPASPAPAPASLAAPVSSAAASTQGSPARAGTPAASPTASASAAGTPTMVAIPDVVGLPFAKARQVLLSVGFTVVGRHIRIGQIVTRTNPSVQAPAGSRIIVVY
jgi:serine/threonine protein kinase